MPQQYSGLIMMIILFALMYFMMIRPQKKRDKEIKEMRDKLAAGDEIITIGGIHGKVVKVNDELVTLELPHAKQRIEFSKWAVGSVTKEAKEKPEVKHESAKITEDTTTSEKPAQADDKNDKEDKKKQEKQEKQENQK
jgi:preprotein translocase subunit YajC